MKNKSKRENGILPIFRYIVTLLAVVNLVLLFVFDYNVPGFSKVITYINNKRDHVEGAKTRVGQSTGNIIIDFGENALVYDGEEPFDPFVDVTVKDSEGNELSKEFLTYIITGETNKEIEYLYTDGEMEGTSVRKLELTDYSGPSVEITKSLADLSDDTLGDLKKLYQGSYRVQDGFGHDCTDQAKIEVAPTTDYDGTFHVVISVTNQFGDSAMQEQNVASAFAIPHLKLTEEEVNVKLGDVFEPHDYILYAVDYDGSNQTESVEIDSNVDSAVLGDYKVKYDLTGIKGTSVKTKILKVHVTE
ncbi:MAG: hypothetical protein Q4E53_10750 [Eubacteriales bacterium]|nr:hypothetical protein [Eubacteriales bacterium]